MRKAFTASDKARIALEALKGAENTSRIASAHQAHPIQVGRWKKTLVERSHELFDRDHSESKIIAALRVERDELHRLVGQRDAELVWLQKKLGP